MAAVDAGDGAPLDAEGGGVARIQALERQVALLTDKLANAEDEFAELSQSLSWACAHGAAAYCSPHTPKSRPIARTEGFRTEWSSVAFLQHRSASPFREMWRFVF